MRIKRYRGSKGTGVDFFYVHDIYLQKQFHNGTFDLLHMNMLHTLPFSRQLVFLRKQIDDFPLHQNVMFFVERIAT